MQALSILWGRSPRRQQRSGCHEVWLLHLYEGLLIGGFIIAGNTCLAVEEGQAHTVEMDDIFVKGLTFNRALRIDQHMNPALHILNAMSCQKAHQFTGYSFVAFGKQTPRIKEGLQHNAAQFEQSWTVTLKTGIGFGNANDAAWAAHALVFHQNFSPLPCP